MPTKTEWRNEAHRRGCNDDLDLIEQLIEEVQNDARITAFKDALELVRRVQVWANNRPEVALDNAIWQLEHPPVAPLDTSDGEK